MNSPVSKSKRRPLSRPVSHHFFAPGLAIGLCVLGVLAYFYAAPLYQKLQTVRAHMFADEAIKLFKQNRRPEALQKAALACKLSPQDLRTLRVAANLGSQANLPDALERWKRVLALDASVPEDHRGLARAAIAARKNDLAQEQVDWLLANNDQDPDNLQLAAELRLVLGDYQGGLDLATRAVQLDPNNQSRQFLLSRLLVDSSDESTRSSGWQMLKGISERQDVLGLQALTFMAKRQDIPEDYVRQVIWMIDVHPLSQDPERVLALGLEIANYPHLRESRLDEAMSERKNATPEVLYRFGVWLNTQREYERTLKLLPFSVAKSRKDLLLVHLDALAALNRWSEVDRLLQTKFLPLEGTYREVFRARCAMELGAYDVDLRWRQAQSEASRNPETMWFLATYTEKIGKYDVAEPVYRQLLKYPLHARAAYNRLIWIADRQGRTNDLFDLLQEMMVKWPSDPMVQNDYAYICLLKNKDIRDAFTTAQALVKNNPLSLPQRSTLALAYCRLGDPAGAQSVYAGMKANWEAALPGNQAVYAAVLALNGKKKEAREFVKKIPVKRLKTEERALIASLL